MIASLLTTARNIPNNLFTISESKPKQKQKRLPTMDYTYHGKKDGEIRREKLVKWFKKTEIGKFIEDAINPVSTDKAKNRARALGDLKEGMTSMYALIGAFEQMIDATHKKLSYEETYHIELDIQKSRKDLREHREYERSMVDVSKEQKQKYYELNKKQTELSQFLAETTSLTEITAVEMIAIDMEHLLFVMTEIMMIIGAALNYDDLIADKKLMEEIRAIYADWIKYIDRCEHYRRQMLAYIGQEKIKKDTLVSIMHFLEIMRQALDQYELNVVIRFKNRIHQAIVKLMPEMFTKMAKVKDFIRHIQDSKIYKAVKKLTGKSIMYVFKFTKPLTAEEAIEKQHEGQSVTSGDLDREKKVAEKLEERGKDLDNKISELSAKVEKQDGRIDEKDKKHAEELGNASVKLAGDIETAAHNMKYVTLKLDTQLMGTPLNEVVKKTMDQNYSDIKAMNSRIQTMGEKAENNLNKVEPFASVVNKEKEAGAAKEGGKAQVIDINQGRRDLAATKENIMESNQNVDKVKNIQPAKNAQEHIDKNVATKPTLNVAAQQEQQADKASKLVEPNGQVKFASELKPKIGVSTGQGQGKDINIEKKHVNREKLQTQI